MAQQNNRKPTNPYGPGTQHYETTRSTGSAYKAKPQVKSRKAAARRGKQDNLMLKMGIGVVCLLLLAGFIYFLFTSDKNNAVLPPDSGNPPQSQSTSQQTDALQGDTSALSGANSGTAPAETPSSTVEEPSVQPAQDIPKEEWYMRLINEDNPLPADFSVELVAVDAAGHTFDARGAQALKQMIADGNAQGLNLMICSTYRSVERQTTLFNSMVSEYQAQGKSYEEAYAITKTIRAIPGCSEHNSGLAADIVSVYYQTLDSGFDQTPEYAWLSANAAEYGFILRYPYEKQDVTKIIYEPWHYRYVGVEQAKKIKESGLCLEEYLA
ncbi:MAG: M15 family metallopeptidase [Oscillospiraceae bacterium]|nr:M15 family metallopeptidase [Oscillospiraceae bacterium]